MIITLFRSRLRPEHAGEYAEWAHRMESLARTMPGFRSIKTFSAPDGERLSVVEFESEVTHQAWRNHPEHRQAQRLGREKFYSTFHLQICHLDREYGL